MEQVDPKISIQNLTQLNGQQIHMLNTFKNEWPEQDFAEIRKLIIKLLAKRIDEQWEQLEEEKGWTEETYNVWRNEHMRTPYKKVQ